MAASLTSATAWPPVTTMYQATKPLAATKPAQYADLVQHAEGLLHGESDGIANAANLAALIYDSLENLNWAGFYFLRGGELVLGPFQGKPACVRIAIGRGVCGAAAARREPVLVHDVHEFPDHIVCDSASRSELVVPLIWGGELLGVLDLDSPQVGRFDADDRDCCVRLAAVLLKHSHEF